MEIGELGVAKAKEAGEVLERARSERQLLPAFVWRLEGVV